MRLLTVTVLLALALSSCATSKLTYLPDGKEGYSINCSGAAVPINACFEKAGALCGSRGYNVYDRNNQIIPAGAATKDFTHFGAFNTKGILIACR